MERNSYAMTVSPPAESGNLDFLRSIAVLLVLVDHLFIAAGLAGKFPSAFVLGHLGVLLFFVHTSLVLMLSLERSDERTSRNVFRDFYIRRAFRIYPLSIACVVLVCAFQVPFMPNTFFTRTPFQILTNLLLVQNVAGQPSVIGPLWSLPLEVEMYIALPFLYIFAKRHNLAALVALDCAALLVGLIWEHFQPRVMGIGLMRLTILRFIPCFVAGVLAYRMSKNRTLAIPAWIWPIAVGAVVASYVLWEIPAREEHYRAYHGWAICSILGILIPQFQDMKLRWLRKASHYVAKYSYGIYLGQIPALWIGYTFWPQLGGGLRCLVSLTLLAVIAVVGYHAIEHPGMILGRLSANRWSGIKVLKPSAMSLPNAGIRARMESDGD
jgi:peptidoglycan/LPS O-acetylase OafA/YrhL